MCPLPDTHMDILGKVPGGRRSRSEALNGSSVHFQDMEKRAHDGSKQSGLEAQSRGQGELAMEGSPKL